jgi:hypothetical protein
VQKISDDVINQFSKEFNEMVGLERVFSKHTFGLELDIIEQCALAEEEIQDSSDTDEQSGSSYSSESSSDETKSLNEEDKEIEKLASATKSILLDDQIGTGILGKLENLTTSLPISSDDSSQKKEVKNNPLITEVEKSNVQC